LTFQKKIYKNSSENGDMSNKKEGFKTSRLKLMDKLSNGL